VVEEAVEPKPDGGLLHKALESLIRLFASKSAEERAEALTLFEEHFISLSMDEGVASISYQFEPDRWETDYYQAPERATGEETQNQRQILRRSVAVKLPLSLTVVCGGLLAETKASSTANLPFPPSGEASASADPEPSNDDAPSLPGPGASIRNHDRPRANATTEARHTSEVRGLGEIPQARSESRPVSSPKGDPDHACAYP
jgi:hypothetical protein